MPAPRSMRATPWVPKAASSLPLSSKRATAMSVSLPSLPAAPGACSTGPAIDDLAVGLDRDAPRDLGGLAADGHVDRGHAARCRRWRRARRRVEAGERRTPGRRPRPRSRRRRTCRRGPAATAMNRSDAVADRGDAFTPAVPNASSRPVELDRCRGGGRRRGASTAPRGLRAADRRCRRPRSRPAPPPARRPGTSAVRRRLLRRSSSFAYLPVAAAAKLADCKQTSRTRKDADQP